MMTRIPTPTSSTSRCPWPAAGGGTLPCTVCRTGDGRHHDQPIPHGVVQGNHGKRVSGCRHQAAAERISILPGTNYGRQQSGFSRLFSVFYPSPLHFFSLPAFMERVPFCLFRLFLFWHVIEDGGHCGLYMNLGLITQSIPYYSFVGEMIYISEKSYERDKREGLQKTIHALHSCDHGEEKSVSERMSPSGGGVLLHQD
ncbi:MAG: hypothetical protein FD153_1391 [Rhodospirillaceae bacterium]|nr:MAG: hypothetical protein FD153_1391 [Rhodospirillaceae bacterium]